MTKKQLQRNMNAMTISNLTFISEDSEISEDIRVEAYEALLRKIKGSRANKEEVANWLVQHDAQVIEERGNNLDNYLIGRMPSLNIFFELYMDLATNSNELKMLYSEMILLFKNEEFVQSICMKERGNIKKRLQSEDEDIDFLKRAKTILYYATIEEYKMQKIKSVINSRLIASKYNFAIVSKFDPIKTTDKLAVKEKRLLKLPKQMITEFANVAETVDYKRIFSK